MNKKKLRGNVYANKQIKIIGNEKWKKERKKEKIGIKSIFLWKNYLFLIGGKLSAFWKMLFENFYFNPFLWNDRV